jgi:hypothetical protein
MKIQFSSVVNLNRGMSTESSFFLARRLSKVSLCINTGCLGKFSHIESLNGCFLELDCFLGDTSSIKGFQKI